MICDDKFVLLGAEAGWRCRRCLCSPPVWRWSWTSLGPAGWRVWRPRDGGARVRTLWTVTSSSPLACWTSGAAWTLEPAKPAWTKETLTMWGKKTACTEQTTRTQIKLLHKAANTWKLAKASRAKNRWASSIMALAWCLSSHDTSF